MIWSAAIAILAFVASVLGVTWWVNHRAMQRNETHWRERDRQRAANKQRALDARKMARYKEEYDRLRALGWDHAFAVRQARDLCERDEGSAET